MPIHLYNLLARAFMAIPAALGSNWFGLVFTIAVVILGEVIGGLLFGWQAVMKNWKKVTGIGFAALGVGYTLVFIWCVLTTTYTDHVGLNSHIRYLSEKVKAADSHEEVALRSVREDLGSQLTQTKLDCAKTEGKNESLSKQASDQQGTINNCQTEALKLLAPEPLGITPLMLNETVTLGVDHTVDYIVLTNKSVTPANMVVSCDRPLKSGFASIIGSGMIAGGSEVMNKTMLNISIQTPAWTPKSPLRISLQYTSSGTAQCNFQVK